MNIETGGVIAAVVVGIAAGVYKVFTRKSPALAAAREISIPRPALTTAADASGAYMAEGPPDIPDTGRSSGRNTYATRDDLDRFSTTVSNRIDKLEESQRDETGKLEKRIDEQGKETREVVMDLTRAVGRLEGLKK